MLMDNLHTELNQDFQKMLSLEKFIVLVKRRTIFKIKTKNCKYTQIKILSKFYDCKYLYKLINS